MLAVIVATGIVAVLAALIYVARERIGAAGVGMAALRTVAMAALFLGFFNPSRSTEQSGGAPLVLLDASLSMDAAGGQWTAALDTARARAGSSGEVVPFGSSLDRSRQLEPVHGTSRVAEALRASAGWTGPVIVVTDGEIDDVGAIPPSLIGRASIVTLPRVPAVDVALADVVVPVRALDGDSIGVTVVVTAGDGVVDSAGTLTVSVGERELLVRNVPLPSGGGVARRRFHIPAGALTAGTHVVQFTVVVAGDAESRNDTRWRVVTVTDQPDIVVVADPADVTARFLVRELTTTSRSAVQGFARLTTDRWVEMATLQPVGEQQVRAAVAAAALVVTRGSVPVAGARPQWVWPAGVDPTLELFEGDWYVTGSVPASPFAGRLAAVEWDSLPPLSGIVPVVPGRTEWIALSGRLGRRGSDRPVLVGADSAGQRRLTTTGTGLWRWALRGGAALEAYRAVISTGIDWLLESSGPDGRAGIVVSDVVQRGMPVVVERFDQTVGDSLSLDFAGPDSTVRRTLRFDASGRGVTGLPPGEYRWTVQDTPTLSGTLVVEAYSSEFFPGTVTFSPVEGGAGFTTIVSHARDTWWLFSIAILAFLGEWGWRQRRGLP